MSVKWADVSSWQTAVNDSYPYRVFAFRSNDGTGRDSRFAANYAWAKSAIDRGKLDFFIVYAVYEPDGGNWVSTLMNLVGTPHPRMVVMIDVESWNGRISGDHSADINAGRSRIAQWLGNSNRVIGYGNRGDLDNLWPNKGDAQVVVAKYGGSPPVYPRMIAHQYTNAEQCSPFGAVDMNSANVDVPTLMSLLGLIPGVAGGGAIPFKPTQETDMPVFTDTDRTIYWPNGWYNVYDPGVYQAVKAYFTNGGQIIDGTAGTVQREVWAATNGVINATAKAVTDSVVKSLPASTVSLSDAQTQALEAAVVAGINQSGVTLPQSERDAIATAVRDKLASDPLK